MYILRAMTDLAREQEVKQYVKCVSARLDGFVIGLNSPIKESARPTKIKPTDCKLRAIALGQVPRVIFFLAHSTTHHSIPLPRFPIDFTEQELKTVREGINTACVEKGFVGIPPKGYYRYGTSKEEWKKILAGVRVGDSYAWEIYGEELYPQFLKFAEKLLQKGNNTLHDAGDIVAKAIMTTQELSARAPLKDYHPNTYVNSCMLKLIRKTKLPGAGTITGWAKTRHAPLERALQKREPESNEMRHDALVLLPKLLEKLLNDTATPLTRTERKTLEIIMGHHTQAKDLQEWVRLTDKDIGNELSVTPSTAKAARHKIIKKLGLLAAQQEEEVPAAGFLHNLASRSQLASVHRNSDCSIAIS